MLNQLITAPLGSLKPNKNVILSLIQCSLNWCSIKLLSVFRYCFKKQLALIWMRERIFRTLLRLFCYLHNVDWRCECYSMIYVLFNHRCWKNVWNWVTVQSLAFLTLLAVPNRNIRFWKLLTIAACFIVSALFLFSKLIRSSKQMM